MCRTTSPTLLWCPWLPWVSAKGQKMHSDKFGKLLLFYIWPHHGYHGNQIVFKTMGIYGQHTPPYSTTRQPASDTPSHCNPHPKTCPLFTESKKAKKGDFHCHSNQLTIWLNGPPPKLQLLNLYPWWSLPFSWKNNNLKQPNLTKSLKLQIDK